LIAESVSRSDGVLLTGGNDVNPALYAGRLRPALQKTVAPGPPERDLRELLLIGEIFRQRKPVLAICRGHQIMNVALGGTLVVDIATEVPRALNHRRMDRKGEVVHEARLTEGSLLAKITGKQHLGVNSTHHQAVGRVAGPLMATAVSRDGVVEAMELTPECRRALPFFLTVQFHPERLAPRHAEHRALFDDFVRACLSNSNSKV
jgi:putative glutamine amidotransferase